MIPLERRRDDDATACLVIEQKHVWLWIVGASLISMGVGVFLGAVLFYVKGTI